jgi:phage tail protein X
MLANADLVPGGDSLVGSVRTYLCKKGFQETGVLEAVCTANHGVTSWDGPHNLCIRKYIIVLTKINIINAFTCLSFLISSTLPVLALCMFCMKSENYGG